MAETYTVQAFTSKGQKPNPHGGILHKWEVSLYDEQGETHEQVYWQSKSDELHEGQQVYGDIEDGEYGPRFRTAQKPDGSGNQGPSGGTFSASRYQKEGLTKDEFWDDKRQRDIESQARQGRAHAQEMAIRFAQATGGLEELRTTRFPPEPFRLLIDWFHQDVQRFPIDADVGGGPKSTEASPPTADVSAEGFETGGIREQLRDKPSEEASPAQKGKLTNLFGKANLSRDAMKAVVLFRCRSEKATKDGASKLIQDLMDGATHDTLLAEIHDAKRAGDAVAIRAAKLIPSDTPLAEPEPEVVEEPNGESIPF